MKKLTIALFAAAALLAGGAPVRQTFAGVITDSIQGARNGSSADRKCWQPVELGIHGLNRWLVKCREMSRKRGVQAARNGPSRRPAWPRRK